MAPALTLPAGPPSFPSIFHLSFSKSQIHFFQPVSTEVGTGAVKACIQATVSNERSSLLSGMGLFHVPRSHISLLFPWTHLSLPVDFQQLILEPRISFPFCSNFAWAVGLVPSSTSQNSIKRVCHHLAGATKGSAVGFVNRKLSPYDSHFVLASPFARCWRRRMERPERVARPQATTPGSLLSSRRSFFPFLRASSPAVASSVGHFDSFE